MFLPTALSSSCTSSNSSVKLPLKVAPGWCAKIKHPISNLCSCHLNEAETSCALVSSLTAVSSSGGSLSIGRALGGRACSHSKAQHAEAEALKAFVESFPDLNNEIDPTQNPFFWLTNLIFEFSQKDSKIDIHFAG